MSLWSKHYYLEYLYCRLSKLSNVKSRIESFLIKLSRIKNEYKQYTSACNIAFFLAVNSDNKIKAQFQFARRCSAKNLHHLDDVGKSDAHWIRKRFQECFTKRCHAARQPNYKRSNYQRFPLRITFFNFQFHDKAVRNIMWSDLASSSQSKGTRLLHTNDGLEMIDDRFNTCY